VGNLTLGGTGKTTATRRLARDLIGRGLRPGIVLRGHRRSSRDPCLLVSDGSGPQVTREQAGDEAAMLAQGLRGAMVAVGKRRERVIDLLARRGAAVALLDDGFQYFRMRRQVDLVLFDATFDLDGARLFPAGYLREPLSHLHRATHVLITHTNLAPTSQVRRLADLARRHAPRAPVMLSRHAPARVHRLGRPADAEPAESLAGRAVLAMSAVGNPSSFEGLLLELGARVECALPFEDHHAYRPADWERVGDALRGRAVELIAVTEKDAVKLPPPPEGLPPVAVVEVDLAITQGHDVWEALVASVADVGGRDAPA